MPTASLIAETLDAYRRAEAAARAFAPGTTGHETAVRLVVELRSLFVELSNATESAPRLGGSEETIRLARQALDNLGR